ncbi:hypothetical protein ACTI_60520 [Actinoplanes sp. OR16]|uniref:SMI1/KNR4 family protein n=1 Tax=Actinoplanes sp. OR16 TaxID=946334 RepID=UPI000F707A2A|nr:SMI1/KNR4 family protein [Actinoplanes sp. OR16]BBH69367.1 hypothetical protein ACTI_60520 [Actinoplanes sp. OR16]
MPGSGSDLGDSIGRLSEILQQSPFGADPFTRPGCSPEAIAELESTVGIELPADYRNLLRTIDGQDPNIDLGLPPERSRLLSAREVGLRWRELLEYHDQEDPAEALQANGVREIPFHPRRIPIMEDRSAGVFLFLDFLPGEGGRDGQIITNATESDMLLVVENVTELIDSYIRILTEGEARVEVAPDDYGGGFWVTSHGQLVDVDRFLGLIQPR